MSELDDALDQLNEVQAEVDDDDFDPRSGTPPPSAKTINSMAQDIYDALPKDDEGTAASTTFFDDSHAFLSPISPPTCRVNLLRVYAYWMPIGACNPI